MPHRSETPGWVQEDREHPADELIGVLEIAAAGTGECSGQNLAKNRQTIAFVAGDRQDHPGRIGVGLRRIGRGPAE